MKTKIISAVGLLLITYNLALAMEKITITIKGLDKQEIYFENNKQIKDTIPVSKQGTYIIENDFGINETEFVKTTISFPIARLSRFYPETKLKGMELRCESNKIELFLYKNCEIEIDIWINETKKIIEYSLKESGKEKINELLVKFNKEYYPLESQRTEMELRMLTKMNNAGLSILNPEDVAKVIKLPEVMAMEEEGNALAKKTVSLVTEMLKNNNNNYLPVTLLYLYKKQIGTRDSVEKLFVGLPEFQKNSFFGKKLKTYFDGFKTTNAGTAAKIFGGTTFDKKQFTLQQLKGKFVILDFWGTWCRPCVGGLPHMAELYKKHQGVLEIVGVASDKEKAWRTFLEKNTTYNWIQLLDTDSKIQTDYGVSAFPTKILLDKEGRILLKGVGEDPNFYLTVEKYLSGEIK